MRNGFSGGTLFENEYCTLNYVESAVQIRSPCDLPSGMRHCKKIGERTNARIADKNIFKA